MATVASPRLIDIQRNARTYPGYLLPRGGSALSLFAAAYHGWNDSIHFLRHNMTGHCVDLDAKKLKEMQAIYPDTWAFSQADAWEFAQQMAYLGAEWDVVSVDTFLGDATGRSLESVALWTLLARQLVTMTVPPKAEVEAPPGWKGFLFPRSPRASWLVLERV